MNIFNSLLKASLKMIAVASILASVAAAQTGAPVRTGESILIYVKLDTSKLRETKNEFIANQVLPKFGSMQATEFISDKVNFLLENSNGSIKTLAGNLIRTHLISSIILTLYGKPVPEYYHQSLFNPAIDFLVKIDLQAELNKSQILALQSVRDFFESVGSISISKTTNYLFFSSGPSADSNLTIGFINGWLPAAGSKAENDKYWLEKHGPFAVSLGLPKELVTYSQLHTDLAQPDDRVFDIRFPGMSMQTLVNEKALTKLSFSPSVLKTNARLIVDEQNFTASPQFVIFQKIDLANLSGTTSQLLKSLQ